MHYLLTDLCANKRGNICHYYANILKLSKLFKLNLKVISDSKKFEDYVCSRKVLRKEKKSVKNFFFLMFCFTMKSIKENRKSNIIKFS